VHRHKVIVCGDHAQLAAVESGGGMQLLAGSLGHVQLAEAVRFADEWEQEASLRLRAGDAAAVEDYDHHGRIRGGPPEEAMADARRLYVSQYVQGRDVELIVSRKETGREMARQIRSDLRHLGLLPPGPQVQIARGQAAGAGDVIRVTRNHHRSGVANGDILRIEEVNGDGSITVRRGLDRDPATGARRWAEDTFQWRRYGRAESGLWATAHAAQGRTVTTGIALVTGTEDAQWLYSAMTRGADANLACVFTHTHPDLADGSPRSRPDPELARNQRITAERAGLPAPQRGQDTPAGADPGDPADVLAAIIDTAASAARSGAEAHAARGRGDNELAVRHEDIAASARQAGEWYRRQAAADEITLQDYQAWARVTAGSRRLAILADSELRRRHPGLDLEPLQSAEPEAAATELPAMPATEAEAAALAAKAEQARAAFRERLEARQGVLVAPEDPDWQHEGEAWPSAWPARDRDAVLQPQAADAPRAGNRTPGRGRGHVVAAAHTGRGTGRKGGNTAMQADLDVTQIGRRGLDLDGWGELSVWGWDSQAGTLFAQLWRDRDDEDEVDEDDEDPDIWISPPAWVVTDQPLVLANWVAEATGSRLTAVLTAMARSVPGELGDVLMAQVPRG
jgi:hypothetical protein